VFQRRDPEGPNVVQIIDSSRALQLRIFHIEASDEIRYIGGDIGGLGAERHDDQARSQLLHDLQATLKINQPRNCRFQPLIPRESFKRALQKGAGLEHRDLIVDRRIIIAAAASERRIANRKNRLCRIVR
jgi:hypothetical protein